MHARNLNTFCDGRLLEMMKISRLIKLVLPSRPHWTKALANARRLRTSKYSSVYVRRSMTPDERRLDFELRQQAKERNNKAGRRLWVVYRGGLKDVRDLAQPPHSENL
ncbi:hypothetical protein OESDEN_10975 [Oesophagostomum dentatum]|uniref:Uncharacterized protein n=1 Tax=Oesophagostomum dentatum TaxID=61180 RepID=A0A0B1T0D0_OESDE|nr:hypothetical protein OESDEN_10975 [Oesophagostomum dentatum]